jgi:predicted DNA-binding ribbon-helix-helix protein
MSEKMRREAAESAAVDPDADAREVPGRVIKQMVSARLEAQLLKELRLLAEERGVSVSDLLREAAIKLVADSHPAPVRFTARSIARQQILATFGSAGDFTSGIAAVYSDQPDDGSKGVTATFQLVS